MIEISHPMKALVLALRRWIGPTVGKWSYPEPRRGKIVCRRLRTDGTYEERDASQDEVVDYLQGEAW